MEARVSVAKEARVSLIPATEDVVGWEERVGSGGETEDEDATRGGVEAGASADGIICWCRGTGVHPAMRSIKNETNRILNKECSCFVIFIAARPKVEILPIGVEKETGSDMFLDDNGLFRLTLPAAPWPLAGLWCQTLR